MTNDDGFLVDADYPAVTVLYYPDNAVPAHELAARVEGLTSLVPDANDLGRITFLTPLNITGLSRSDAGATR